jgi:hypothetical protein
MHDRIAAVDERGEAIRPIERALAPGDDIRRRLRAPGQRAYLVTGGSGLRDQMRSDEAGRAGDRELPSPFPRHSSTIWSRWTIALRGA